MCITFARHFPRLTVLVVLATACATFGRAQTTVGFTGDFQISGDSTYIYRFGEGGGEFGAWTFDATLTGDGYEEGALWTTNLPDSIILQSHAATTAEGTGTLLFSTEFSMVPNIAGTLSFTATVTQQGNATGGFYYTNWPTTGDPVYSSTHGTGTYTFNIAVEPNGGFAFNVLARDLTGDTGDYDFTSVTISDFSFTTAAVPEPSTCAAFAGALALALAFARRHNARRL
ncbi:MAG: hypothetical protein K0R17_452 [Rariglobus sp.]|jgi:hypothetical protein|nr:hypothetical protein [Rariglobus sp.]